MWGQEASAASFDRQVAQIEKMSRAFPKDKFPQLYQHAQGTRIYRGVLVPRKWMTRGGLRKLLGFSQLDPPEAKRLARVAELLNGSGPSYQGNQLGLNGFRASGRRVAVSYSTSPTVSTDWVFRAGSGLVASVEVDPNTPMLRHKSQSQWAGTFADLYFKPQERDVKWHLPTEKALHEILDLKRFKKAVAQRGGRLPEKAQLVDWAHELVAAGVLKAGEALPPMPAY
jgi:hypothetical protein